MKRTALSPKAAETLELAALLGVEFSLPILLKAADSPETLDPLFDQGWLTEVGPKKARFADPTRIKSLVAGIPWSRKRRLHARLAKAGTTLRLSPAMLATHHEAARDFAAARPLWLLAAEKAGQQKDFRSALGFYRRALEFWPIDHDPARRTLAFFEMCRCATRSDEAAARQLWSEFLALELPLAQRIAATRELAELCAAAEDFNGAGRLLESAAVLAEASSPEDSARAWHAYGYHLLARSLIRPATDAMASALKWARKSKNPALISEILSESGLAAAMGGRAMDAAKFVEQALHIALEHHLPEQTALAYRRRANIRVYCVDVINEVAAHREAIQYCRTLGEKGGELSCLACLSNAHFRLGEWKEATRIASVVLTDKKANPVHLAIARLTQAQLASFRGEQRHAGPLLEENLREFRRLGLAGLDFQTLWARAFYFENEGQPGLAAASYDEIRFLWRDTEDRLMAISGMLFASGFYGDQGRPQDAADCLEILHTIFRGNRNPESRAALRAVTAETSLVHGDTKDAVREFRKAVDLYRLAKLPLETAWTLFRLSRASGDPTAAMYSRNEATHLGMRPLLSRLQGAASAPSPRQRDILALLAQGLTDKEMAARLQLSPRTIEMHVARLLKALDARTRSEAMRKAVERGWLS